MKEFKVGDFVGFIYAQPGNDTTYMVVIEVRKKIKCYDPWFNDEVELDPNKLWHLSEEELAYTISRYKFGTITVGKKLREVKLSYGLNPRLNISSYKEYFKKVQNTNNIEELKILNENYVDEVKKAYERRKEIDSSMTKLIEERNRLESIQPKCAIDITYIIATKIGEIELGINKDKV